MAAVTQSRLQTDVFLAACDICRQTRPLVSHRLLTERFEKTGMALLKKNGLVAAENLKFISVPQGDDEVEAEIVFRGDKKSGYWGENGWVSVHPDDLRQYSLDLPWLLRWIAEGLGISKRVMPRELMSDHVWSIGDAAFGKSSIPVFFARHLRTDDIVDVLLKEIKSVHKGKKVSLDRRQKALFAFFHEIDQTLDIVAREAGFLGDVARFIPVLPQNLDPVQKVSGAMLAARKVLDQAFQQSFFLTGINDDGGDFFLSASDKGFHPSLAADQIIVLALRLGSAGRHRDGAFHPHFRHVDRNVVENLLVADTRVQDIDPLNGDHLDFRDGFSLTLRHATSSISRSAIRKNGSSVSKRYASSAKWLFSARRIFGFSMSSAGKR